MEDNQKTKLTNFLIRKLISSIKMFRVRIFLITFLFLVSSSCFGQEEEAIFILFQDGKNTNCIKSKTNKKKDKSLILYQGKMHKLDNDTFFFCQERFKKTNKQTKVIRAQDIKKISFIEHEALYKKHLKRDMFSKKDTFKVIYIIEKTEFGNYIQHEVYWLDIR
ncbi:hypothetical protein [Kordia sp.]|uniref:hypothetical protein n=1 Tax=Kordia sp. TaxID=1965332 RepID=UPI003B59E06A